jgi:hypothetical protein
MPQHKGAGASTYHVTGLVLQSMLMICTWETIGLRRFSE